MVQRAPARLLPRLPSHRCTAAFASSIVITASHPSSQKTGTSDFSRLQYSFCFSLSCKYVSSLVYNAPFPMNCCHAEVEKLNWRPREVVIWHHAKENFDDTRQSVICVLWNNVFHGTTIIWSTIDEAHGPRPTVEMNVCCLMPLLYNWKSCQAYS